MGEPIPKEEHYSVRWTSHTNNLIHMFMEHRSQDRLADVTLYCEGQCIRAHKIILSSCSTYFQEMFKTYGGGMCGSIIHPFIVFTEEKFSYLTQIVQFMYQGEIKVSEYDLEGVLAMGEKFQVKGLCSVRVKNKLDKPKSDNADISKSQPLMPSATLQMTISPSPETSNIVTPVTESASNKQIVSSIVPFVDFAPLPPLSRIPAHHVPPNQPINILNDVGKLIVPMNFVELPTSSTSTTSVLLAPKPAENVFKRKVTLKPMSTIEKEPTLSIIEHPNTLPARKKMRTDSSVTSSSSVKERPPEPKRIATPPEPKRIATPPEPKRIATPPVPKRISTPPVPIRVTSPEINTSKPDTAPQIYVKKSRKKEESHVKMKDVPMDEENTILDKPKSLSPFMLFASEWRKKLQVEHPGESNKEISVRLGNLWKNLSFETKQAYYRSAQWQQEPVNDSPPSTHSRKVMQRRKTVDSSVDWRSRHDKGSIEIIDLDRDLSSEK